MRRIGDLANERIRKEIQTIQAGCTLHPHALAPKPQNAEEAPFKSAHTHT